MGLRLWHDAAQVQYNRRRYNRRRCIVSRETRMRITAAETWVNSVSLAGDGDVDRT